MSSEHQTAGPAGLSWFRPPQVWISAPLLALIAVYCRHLWPEWRHNPDLVHGFFTPVIFVVLVLESERVGPLRWLPAGLGPWLAGGTIGLAVILFGISGLLAASVGWNHVLVEFLLSATLAGVLLSGLFCLSSVRWKALPLNWVSLTAAGIWLLSAPLPSGTYARMTLALQGGVSSGVIHTLHLLGIPARQHGNIIELTRTTVGVEEACSGIRSLLSCLYAGVFLAAWQVRSPGRRLLLIGAAPLLAIGLNFVRSLGLTLMTNAGVDIDGFWHDAIGYAIIGLTAVILVVFARWLGPVEPVAAQPAAPAAMAGPVPIASIRLFGLGYGLLTGLALIFSFYGRPGPAVTTAAFDPASLLPAEAEGWQVTTADNLYQFAGILRTNQLVERTYFRNLGGQPVVFSIYIAHWNPGQAPVSLVASHTPDACWPGAGWLPLPNLPPQATLTVAGHMLPRTEHRIFQSPGSAPMQVWFWHMYDGRVINYRDPYSVPALLELAWRYGFRREGEQYFIRISSNQPWDRLAQEPLFGQIFAHLARIGLTR